MITSFANASLPAARSLVVTRETRRMGTARCHSVPSRAWARSTLSRDRCHVTRIQWASQAVATREFCPLVIRGFPRAISRRWASRGVFAGGESGLATGPGDLALRDEANPPAAGATPDLDGLIVVLGAGERDEFGFFAGPAAAAGAAAFLAGGDLGGTGLLAGGCRAAINWALVSPDTLGMPRCLASFSRASRVRAVSGGVGIKGLGNSGSPPALGWWYSVTHTGGHLVVLLAGGELVPVFKNLLRNGLRRSLRHGR